MRGISPTSFRSVTVVWLLPCVLVTASAVLRYIALTQTPYANGWDSYFYLVQLKSLETSGVMHSPEASLIYPWFRLWYWCTGDYILALQLGTALLAGAFTAVVYRIAVSRQQDGRFPLTALLLASWTVFSPHLTYFAAQYPKNLLGLVLLTAFVACLERPGTASRRRAGYCIVLLIANYFGHRMTFVLALVYGLLWVWNQQKQLGFQRFFTVKTLVVSAFAGVLFAGGGSLFPGLFHRIDFGRLAGVLHWPPQWAPWSFVQQFGLERISGWWLGEVLVTTVCWLAATGCGLKKQFQGPMAASVTVLCGLLLFPFWEWSFTGIAWRAFLVFVLFTPLLVIDYQSDKWHRSGLVFVVVLLCCSLFSWKSYHPKQHAPDYARFESVTARALPTLQKKKTELVIAHNALAEFFTFTSGIDAMPWLPEYPLDSSQLWRIATGTRLQTLRYHAGAEASAVEALGYQYFLLPEYVWQAAIKRAKAEGDELFLAEIADWRNPSRIRPGWLLHRKRER
jgi:hypothetical protein